MSNLAGSTNEEKLMNVLITGITGRVGSNVAKDMISKGVKVRGAVMPNDAARPRAEALGCELVEADLRDEKALAEACKGIDVLCHFAAIMENIPRGMTMPQYFDINSRGFFCLMEIARGMRLRKFVYTSSTAVYDVWTVRNPPVRETHPCRPTHTYGFTKLVNEELARCYHFRDRVPVVALRLSYVLAGEAADIGWDQKTAVWALKEFGADPRCGFYAEGVREPWKAVEQQCPDCESLICPRSPDGRPWTWHLTDVRDVTHAVWRAIESPVTGEVFNIAGPDTALWDAVGKHLSARMGKPYREVTIPNVWHLEFDISKARTMLGYDPQYTTRRMLDDSLAMRDGKDVGVIRP
jgi:UDP-glucose 4-epimerase